MDENTMSETKGQVFARRSA